MGNLSSGQQTAQQALAAARHLAAAGEVLEVPGADIEPTPSFGARIRADFMEGMGKIGGKFVILLNIQRVLSVEEVATLATVTQHVAEEAGAEA